MGKLSGGRWSAVGFSDDFHHVSRQRQAGKWGGGSEDESESEQVLHGLDLDAVAEGTAAALVAAVAESVFAVAQQHFNVFKFDEIKRPYRK